jgi:hypothetical protein
VHADDSATAWVEVLRERHTNFRPSTSDGDGPAQTSLRRKKASSNTPHAPLLQEMVQSTSSNRPFTAAVAAAAVAEEEEGPGDRDQQAAAGALSATRGQPEHPAAPLSSSARNRKETVALHIPPNSNSNSTADINSGRQNFLQDCDLVSCRVLTLALESTWGDKSYIGLCGIEVMLGCSSVIAELTSDAIDASPRDLSAIG